MAIAPDGSWLATGSGDGTVLIWDTGGAKAWALMRVEGSVYACEGLDDGGLVAGGPDGLYLFDFLPGTAPPPARH